MLRGVDTSRSMRFMYILVFSLLTGLQCCLLFNTFVLLLSVSFPFQCYLFATFLILWLHSLSFGYIHHLFIPFNYFSSFHHLLTSSPYIYINFNSFCTFLFCINIVFCLFFNLVILEHLSCTLIITKKMYKKYTKNHYI